MAKVRSIAASSGSHSASCAGVECAAKTSSTVMRAFTLLFACSLIASSFVECANANPAKAVNKNRGAAESANNLWRLPTTVTPVSYDLTFEPDIERATFKGGESIHVKIRAKCNEIIVNSDGLTITEPKLRAPDGYNAAKVVRVEIDQPHQRAKFVLDAAMPPGDYILSFRFSGKLNDDLAGFYRCFYEDNAHKRHYLTATQMEPTDARKMFPCFDEPALKAIFNIKALVGAGDTAISNAAIASETKDGNKKLVTFEPTPPMSSYLVALLTGKWKRTGEKIVDGVKLAVWAPEGKESLGKFSLEEAAKSFAYQNKYFSLPYPFKKLDLIAVPEFSMGGMENWGAITFSDDILLIDEKTASIFHKQSASEVISHEIAHQWFGDLVTMKWWDDLWLNESFATWMESKVTEALHPEWETHFDRVSSRNGILGADARRTTHPIHAVVVNPSQAMESFDGITYQKGSAVLTMLESFLGADEFKKGVIHYLAAHKMGTATAEDFWSALGGKDTAEIMRGFVMQAGAPIVHAGAPIASAVQSKNLRASNAALKSVSPASTSGSKFRATVGSKSNSIAPTLDLSQWRFFETGRDRKEKALWKVPMQIRDLTKSSSSATRYLLDKSSDAVSLDSIKVPFINAKGLGYYRTSYDPKLLAQIQANFDNLSDDEKISFISDCQELLLSGEIPVEDAYNLLKRMNSEKSYEVLAQMIYLVQSPYTYMKAAHKKEYQRFAQRLAIPLKKRVNGWNSSPSDSQSKKGLRSAVLSMLGTEGQDPQTIKEGLALFSKYCGDRTSVNPDLVRAVFSIATYNGGRKEYEQMKQLWKTANNPRDKGRALNALAEFHPKELAQETIKLARSSDVSKQDGLSMLLSLASDEYTRDVGWPYLKQHWSELVKTYPRDEVTGLIYAGGPIEDRARQKEVLAWQAAHPVPHTTERKKRHDENVETSLLYRERYAKRIVEWVLKTGSNI